MKGDYSSGCGGVIVANDNLCTQKLWILFVYVRLVLFMWGPGVNMNLGVIQMALNQPI